MSTNESVGNITSSLLSSISAALSTHLQDKALKKMDTDGNGSVGQSEFQAAMEKVSGKLGVDMGEGVAGLFASFDSDADGALNAAEVGQAIKNLFMPPENTQAFVQSRGDPARFAELDADGDGSISMAEFGITPNGSGEFSMVSTTTTTTTYVSSTGEAPTGIEALAGTPAAAESVASASVPADASAEPAAVTAAADPLDKLLSTVDIDGDGQISGAELSAFVAQLSSQLEAATKKYNDVALAAASNTTSNGLNEAA